MEKTLVVLIGNARGGEEAWHTMYENLLEPYNADLALCFGKSDDHSASLYKKAKYVWECEEYEDWNNYYEQNCTGNWRKVFTARDIGGDSDNWKQSILIIFAFRHFLLHNHRDTLLQYDRLIVTRSDFYYIDKHPILPNDSFYVVEAEDNGGIGDRHHIFHKDMLDDVLGIVDSMDDPNKFNYWMSTNWYNAESTLLAFFYESKIIDKLKRCKRVQCIVAVEGDKTRYREPHAHLPGSDTTFLKYGYEYILAMDNRTNGKPDIIPQEK